MTDSPTLASQCLSLTRGNAQVYGWEGGGEPQTHHPGCSLLRFTFPAEPGSCWHLDDAIASWGSGRRVTGANLSAVAFPRVTGGGGV